MFNFKFRAIACLVVAAFLIENCAAAAGMTAPQWSSVLPQKNSGTSEQDLQVPADLAIIKSDKNYSSDLKIISIEDVYFSIDAQKKIAELLHELVSRYQLSMVGLEGSRGVLDTALLSSFPHQESKKQVAESMLRNTQINAGEFFKIFYDESQVELFGIEDESLYAGNIEAYQKLLSLQDPVRDELSNINDLLTSLRPRVFSSEILSFVVAQKKFEEANLDFSEYWEIVRNYVRNSGITLEKYPNVLKLSRTSELESEIDFEKANAERDQLMRK